MTFGGLEKELGDMTRHGRRLPHRVAVRRGRKKGHLGRRRRRYTEGRGKDRRRLEIEAGQNCGDHQTSKHIGLLLMQKKEKKNKKKKGE